MTYLTVPITAKNLEEGTRQITAAFEAGAQMLELRTDYLENPTSEIAESLIGKIKKCGLPVIVTCRDKKQGGLGDWPQDLRTKVLIAAAMAGADYVDCEYENFLIDNVEKPLKKAVTASGCRLILSHHNFDGPFDDIQKLYDIINTEYPAAIPKLVYTARHINDCFAAFDLLHNKNGDAIVFAMGEAGMISRLIAKKLDSLITFASIDENTATAPGQLTISQFNNFRGDIINEKTRLFGVIADPVAHSISPAVHNACFAKAGINGVYLPLRVKGDKAGFDAFMENVIARPWLDFGGFSVTIPHKLNAIEYLEKVGGFIEPAAVRIGAVNTITIGLNDRVSGYNTDCAGAIDAITDAMQMKKNDLNGMSVAVVGAGGASRAVIAGLVDAGAIVTVYNRTIQKAHQLAGEFEVHSAPLSEIKNMQAKLLINGTSIGMKPDIDQTPVPKEFLKSDMIVFDTVYNPLETRLLKEAKEVGAKTVSGAEMFINQAARQFNLFTRQNCDITAIRKIVFNLL